jgi:hypothetical protein
VLRCELHSPALPSARSTSGFGIPFPKLILEPEFQLGSGLGDLGNCPPRYIRRCAALTVLQLDTAVSFAPICNKMSGLQTADRSTFPIWC